MQKSTTASMSGVPNLYRLSFAVLWATPPGLSLSLWLVRYSSHWSTIAEADAVAVDYLIHPPQDVKARPGAGIAIIVIYFVLFILMALSYLRILQVVATNPGFVPLSQTSGKKSSTKSARTGETTGEKEDSLAVGSGLTPSDRTGYLDRGALTGGRASAPSGLEIFYKRDVFECEIDGLPRWCSTCNIWKPDRSHHCREVGRCVYKMDHYCPWCVQPPGAQCPQPTASLHTL